MTFHQKQVPYYANHEDSTWYMLAVYRTVFDYFLHRKISWDELKAFTGHKPGKTAWPLKALTQLGNMDFDIRMLEPFDYNLYAEEGEQYLNKVWSQNEIVKQRSDSNILDIRPQIPGFLRKVAYENRIPLLEDIDAMLEENRLVSVAVNSRALNGLEGFADHAVVVIKPDDNGYLIHDPGFPAEPNRHITRDLLRQAMIGEYRTSRVIGFKLKPRRNLRLDHYVIDQYPLFSRAYAVRLIEEGKVLVDGQNSKPGYKLRERDTITIDYNQADAQAIPDIELPILYEDDDCVVISKPLGVLTHSRGSYIPEATVASFLRAHLYSQVRASPQQSANLMVNADGFGEQSVIGLRNQKLDIGAVRAGIVHRLDRATSGVMICAKTPEALAWFQKQFHDRQTNKIYVAVIRGKLDPAKAVIDMPIERNPKAPATFRVGANGKSAITAYRTLRSNNIYSMVELQPKTGRTHQLRVHMAEQKHPIVGDFLYDGEPAQRLFLHALSLEIVLPDGTAKTFTAEMPVAFTEKLNKLL